MSSAAARPGRVLIANRGEIAVRIARAARDVGIETVGVFSDADRECRHVRVVDRAVCIGPAPAQSSYLKPDALVHVAEATGCDAVHPGYGFLAEDADFAQQVCDAGMTWVGPTPESIRTMGHKAAARAAAMSVDVPVVPGSDSVIADVAEAIEFGNRHGYPLLLKASAGGGGKGMRIVADATDLPRTLSLARQEAAGAFGNDSMYIEKYLPRVRHVEVQLLGDADGHVVAIGDRDCSIQRRHQKVVEEAPAAVPETTRRAMSSAATRLAASVRYRNAGTVEFLVDVETGAFYFIEMNTRIQVEHPVTEEVSGVDLVAWQLRIAAGECIEELTALEARGHAIEFRVTAEDPERDFLPVPGLITEFEIPGGPGIRCDSHVTDGYRVPPYYDSLLAKLVVSGRDREQAIRRARRALAEFRVGGIANTIGFHRWLLQQPEFIEGSHTTAYLSDALSGSIETQEVPT
ncbi:MAG: acetyl-CoA carboxylase biotin carboxylase subunit [Actinophytocola sp.]|nr:acetyl-CoA carboxylase biotin carboxylase subunit [Actinophytocola sp.]